MAASDFLNADIRVASGLTAAQINSYVNSRARIAEKNKDINPNLNKSLMIDCGELVLRLEMEFGINAGFIVALAANESGWGTSNFAHKYHSFIGYGATNENPDNTKKYGGATVEAGVRNSLGSLRQDYIINRKAYTINQFQDKRWAYSQQPVGTPNPAWPATITSIWSALQGSPKAGSSITPSGPSSSNATSGSGRDVALGAELVGRQWDWATYTIEKGDSIQSVAKMFGQTVAWICKWNGITTGKVLQPGWVLRVYPYYTVGEGDTMTAVTKDFGVTSAQIHTLNPHLSSMAPNTKIRLPNSVIDDSPPTSYDQVNKQAILAEERLSIELPLQPVVGSAPHVEDDEYPAHRALQNPFCVRIGDVQLYLPPTSIKTHKEGFVDTNQTLRTQTGMMTRSGHTKRTIELELYFADTDMINGYRVKGPMGATYYMDGLRPLIAQFMKNPFLPIRNELLNERLHVYNVAFSDLTVEMHEDFDNVLIATLKLIECTIEPFVQYPDFYYDSMFMYPMFRWWYQQAMLDKAESRLTARHLAPVPQGSMRNEIIFRVLDRDLVEQRISETNMYVLSQMKTPYLDDLMTEWAIGNAVLQKVTLGISKNLQPIYTDSHEMPCFQDLGGMNKEFILEFLCTNRAELESLNNMVAHLEEMSRDFRQRFVSGFLGVTNDMVNLMGVYNAMVLSIDTETISDFDEEYIVRLYCRGFDATQKNNERVEGINSYMGDVESMFSFSDDPNILVETKTNRSTGALYEAAIEEALNFVELYPDLELPTYSDLNIAIEGINKFRRQYGRKVLPITSIQRPPKGVFVDPDFYFAYPDIKRVFDDLETGQFGQQIVNALDGSNDYRDYVMASNEMDLGWWLDGTDQDLTQGWDSDAFQNMQKTKSTQPVNLSDTVYDHVLPVGMDWNKSNPVPQGQELLEQMTHDMKLYNRRGRMLRAFPSYMIVFVDEGQWLNGKRLWNNYYTYHAIQEMSVVKDRSHPVDLAYIRMTNIYGAFDFSTRMSDPRQFMTKSTGILQRASKLFTNFFLTIDDKIVQERTQMIDQIKLKQGARIHLRMGYGACPAYMPVVFNGQVATINEGDQLELVCQGDGVELTQIISHDVDGKLPNGAKLREEPQNIFRQILVTRQSDYWFAVSDKWALNQNYASLFGIEHFGYVESKAQDGFWNTFGDLGAWLADKFLDEDLSKVEYDVMKNIYRGEKTTAYTDTYFIFDEEANIKINPFNRSIWDALQAVTLHTPEFIMAPHPHGFHSTLFHGMPHWPVKYGYQRKRDSNGKVIGDADDMNSYEELYKPFQQFHVLASGYDIVHNNIQASSELLKHIAVGMYTKSRGADLTTTFPVYADRTIKQEIQKTMIVDTMVHQNLPGFEWMYDFARSQLGWIGDIINWAGKAAGKIGIDLGIKMNEDKLTKEQQDEIRQKFTQQVNDQVDGFIDPDRIFQPGFEQALASSIGSLQRQFQEMYQGELIILGDPAIKPWDCLFINDEYTLMQGNANVGKVTHTLSFSTGFMTVIKPDLQVTRVDGAQMNELYALIQRAGATAAGYLVRRLAMTKAAKMIAKVTGGATLWSAKKVGSAGLKAGSFAAKLTLGENAVRLASQAVGKSGEIIKGVTNLKNFGMMGTKALKLVKVNMVLNLALGWLIQKAEDWERKEFGFNNVLFIYPLWKAGKPFVAGISGYRHIIPGYIDPEWLPMSDIQKIDTSNPTNVNPNRQPPVPSSTTNPIASSPPPNSKGYGGLPTGSVVPPVNPMRVTSPFGWRPRSNSFHKGIDIGPAVMYKFTTPCVAIADGNVVNIGRNHAEMGNWVNYHVVIDGEDISVTYMHLHTINVAKGQKIYAGDQVGIMGNTGRIFLSTPGDITPAMRAKGYGMHLHFELEKGKYRQRIQANLIDPEDWLRKHNFKYTGGKKG